MAAAGSDLGAATERATDRRFAVLCEIVRAQHFAWREAVRRLAPHVPAAEVAHLMWRITGEQTARAYARRIDPRGPIARQVAEAVVWSSRCMGEDASVEAGASADQAFVRHRACPWFDWHERADLLAEDRPGCDAWFQAMVDGVGRRLSRRLRVETIEALPDGAPSCLRRIWTEP